MTGRVEGPLRSEIAVNRGVADPSCSRRPTLRSTKPQVTCGDLRCSFLYAITDSNREPAD